MPLDETQIIVLPEARELTVGRAVIPIRKKVGVKVDHASVRPR